MRHISQEGTCSYLMSCKSMPHKGSHPHLRQGSLISISRRSAELAAGINIPYRGADYRMSCTQDGSAVSVKAVYQWANDEQWAEYVSDMRLFTHPERRYKGRFLLYWYFRRGKTCCRVLRATLTCKGIHGKTLKYLLLEVWLFFLFLVLASRKPQRILWLLQR